MCVWVLCALMLVKEGIKVYKEGKRIIILIIIIIIIKDW
jgi:hypothetical protein